MAKTPPANAGDTEDAGLIPESGRSPVEVPDNPLHYSCLKNPMDREVWQAMVIGLQRVRQDQNNLAHTHKDSTIEHCVSRNS